ncbi:MAG: flagellar hook-length control protein FliK [Sulfuritalea sp.]|nr:flagellar hook-length control protein FliK [Sulfuritalea sp.]
MPAMPSAPGAIPGIPAPAARPQAGADATASAETQGLGPEAFTAHFRRLIGAPPVTGVEAADRLPAAPEAAPVVDPAALLPFIEALGLTQPPAAAGPPGSRGRTPDGTADPALFAAASSAGQSEAPGRNAGRGLPHPLLVPVPGAFAAAADSSTPPSAVPADALLAGRELSAQIVGAIAAAKESSSAAGGVATAAPAALEAAAPRNDTTVPAGALLREPVGTPGWSEGIGNRLIWLAHHSESQAELILNPPQMGRVEISLTVKGDQVSASFVAGNPVVREALEAALPRLREMLAEAGIQLGQAQVGAENPRQWAHQQKHGDNSAPDPARVPDAAPSSVSPAGLIAGLKGGRGLVDVYA